ncbi:hypothetical protein VB715_21010 [Crocosphaera sp. UHCC 0190]|uniref:hypothetical protein n=1 Tax=Crocosphaera sp. UHCC 0190 TaxID=3110246 RepID=UPI002B1F2A5D|nr:hypothetical protein [Crocosphaera sp. UHCC 0190]MEA5512255.1 hypothetical protein [Crocosphaera sp. UHCC 0190]
MNRENSRNKEQMLNIPIGTPVEIIFVPAPVKNITLGATGAIASQPKRIGMITHVYVQLDDGRLIGWELDYLEII